MKSMMIGLALLTALALAPTCAAVQQDKPEENKPKVIRQADDGTVLLHAKDVSIHGSTVRYEPQPNKNTIGYWTKVGDWVSWDFEITRPGEFKVEILQGCGNGSGGSEVEFAVGEQKLKLVVKETGGFQDFVSRELGSYKVDKAGRYTLSVKPKTKPGVAVMDLRQVKLTPK